MLLFARWRYRDISLDLESLEELTRPVKLHLLPLVLLLRFCHDPLIG